MQQYKIIIIGVVLCSVGALLSYRPARSKIKRWVGVDRFERGVIARCGRVSEQRKEEGFWGRHALVLKSSGNATAIVLGALNGQIDSFNRILEELKKKAILSDSLKIIPKDTYLIVTGPLGDDPKVMSMLSRILDLMEANPRLVFVIRGEYEDKEFWVDKDLGKLLNRLDPYSDVTRATMRNFFNTLPLELYIYPWGEENAPLRVSWNNVEEDRGLACVSIENKAPIQAICSLGDICSMPEPEMGAHIASSPEGVSWETMNGLQVVGRPPVWHLISTESTGFQQKAWVTYDAYAVVHINKTLAQSTIELYQHAMEQPFKPAGSFNLVSGISLS